MRNLVEFLGAVIGAAALICLFQQPIVFRSLKNRTPQARPPAAVLVTTAKKLGLRESPNLEGDACRCYLERGDQLIFLQQVSDRTYIVEKRDGEPYQEPMYKVKVLESANEKCRDLEGWVFGGYVVWDPLAPDL